MKQKSIKESEVEQALRRAVEDEGGLCLKWVCPGHRGVPDRILLFPGELIAFVELKRPGAKVKAGGLQEWWREKIQSFSFRCYEISTVEQAKSVVSTLSTESMERVCADRAWGFADEEELDDWPEL